MNAIKIAMQLEKLAEDMLEMSTALEYYGGFNKVWLMRSQETIGAAVIVTKWAKEIDKVRMGIMSEFEEVHIKFKRFRTPSGTPTCCLDFNKGHYCKFLGAIGLGISQFCMSENEELFRDGNEGYLTVTDGCPLWSED